MLTSTSTDGVVNIPAGGDVYGGQRAFIILFRWRWEENVGRETAARVSANAIDSVSDDNSQAE